MVSVLLYKLTGDTTIVTLDTKTVSFVNNFLELFKLFLRKVIYQYNLPKPPSVNNNHQTSSGSVDLHLKFGVSRQATLRYCLSSYNVINVSSFSMLLLLAKNEINSWDDRKKAGSPVTASGTEAPFLCYFLFICSVLSKIGP